MALLCVVPPGGALLPCDGTCMSVVSVRADPGASGVAVEVVGRAEAAIRGFSLALGHDTSRLTLARIETGPLFAAAELVSTTVHNEASASSDPYGALFVVLDFNTPLDQTPVDISGEALLATLFYDVALGAPAAATPLRLAHRAFGERRVSVIYVDQDNRDVEPALTSGDVVVCGGADGAITSVSPGHGALAGGMEVTLTGEGLSAASRVFFGGREATVVAVMEPAALVARTPPALRAGAVAVSVEDAAGCAVLPHAFEYQLAPVVSEVEPAHGLGGERITIRGERFAPESRAAVGSLELADAIVVSSILIEGTLGACSLQARPGLQDVRVENLNGMGVLPRGYDCSSAFVRAECSGDGEIDLADAVFALFHRFGNGPAPACDDACDANDDGTLNLADVVSSLNFLFQLGAPPPAPFPLEGFDLTGDSLTCLRGG